MMKKIIEWAFGLVKRVDYYCGHARQFFYEVVLAEYSCPRCGEHLVIMIKEGLARCRSCRHEFDPTVAFQRCMGCNGKLRVQIRRYRCSQCGRDITSRFLFDGRIFDGDYFKTRMAEHRQRKQQQVERVRKMLAESRSLPLTPQAVDLGSVPGLIDALNGLTADLAQLPYPALHGKFDLQRYQRHIQARLQPFPINFDRIPPLEENVRLDRIWRFIAIIFLDQAGIVDVRQTNNTIEVMPIETDDQRCRVSQKVAATT